ncbi:MAG: hypothetical protein ACW96X_09705 [Promethearchaeota archaeon]|jgi:hypothetical protein
MIQKNETLVLDEFGKKYLLLGLRIGKLIEGYVESYYGPPELKEIVDKEQSVSPKNLLSICDRLQQDLPNQGFADIRIKFFNKMLWAMETSLNVVNGKNIPYLEQVNRFYDIKAELVDDSIFYKAAEKLDEFYTGTGSYSDLINALEKQRAIPVEKVKETYNHAFEILQTRVKKLFPELLPNNEKISVKIVKNQFYSADAIYTGNYKTQIKINTDISTDWTIILILAAHEGYPGHHTEFAVKEKTLYLEEQQFEHCLVTYQVPKMVISEGIADTAIDVLFSPREVVTIGLEEICPNPKTEYPLDALIANFNAEGAYAAMKNYLAFHAHVDGWSDEKLLKYGLNFGIFSENVINSLLKFIHHPIGSTYAFTYHIGKMLVKKRYGDRPSPVDFKQLLTHQFLPSDLI